MLADEDAVPPECTVKPEDYEYDKNGATPGFGGYETYESMHWIDATYYGCPKWDWL